MNLGELKKEIVDLGFEEDSTLADAEYKRKIVTSINRAIDLINTTGFPIIKSVKVEGEEVYDMPLVVNDFVDFYGYPKITENGVRKSFTDFSIEAKRKLYTNGNKSELEVYYVAYPTRITETTSDDFEIELDRVAQPLLPLLASYFIWLDDDERKATVYQNMYDIKMNEIRANSNRPVSVSFKGGVVWHN